MSIAFTVRRSALRVIAIAWEPVSGGDFRQYVRARTASDVVDFDQLVDLRRATSGIDHDSIVAWRMAEEDALGDRRAGRMAMVLAPGAEGDDLAREIQAELSAVLVESAVFATVADADAWLTAQRERNMRGSDDAEGRR